MIIKKKHKTQFAVFFYDHQFQERECIVDIRAYVYPEPDVYSRIL
jgi:hypothetical protein